MTDSLKKIREALEFYAENKHNRYGGENGQLARQALALLGGTQKENV